MTHAEKNATPLLKHIRRVLKVFLPFALVVCACALLIDHNEVEQRHAEEARREHETIRAGTVAINQTLHVIARELIYLGNHHHIQALLHADNENARHHLASDWLAFSEANQVYHKIRWIDENGKERVRIDRTANGVTTIPQQELQYKGDRYFFQNTSQLKKGEVYVSPLDLNMEHGQIEVPHRPTIRFGMPLFDSQGHRRGIIMVNYSASLLLQRFERETTYLNQHNDWLLNEKGYWLKGEKAEDEFGFMFQRDDLTLASRYPDAWKQIQADEEGQFETTAGLWTFATVHPFLEWKTVHHRGSQAPMVLVGDGFDSDKYSWKSVSFLPADQYNAGLSVFRIKLAIGTLLLLVLFLVGSIRLATAHAEKKALYRQLLVNEARLRVLLENVPDMIWLKDWKGMYLACNAAFKRMAGKDEQAIIGKTDYDLFPTDLADRYRDEDMAAINSGKAYRTDTDSFSQGDAPAIPLETIKVPVQTENGELVGVVGIARDVGERKKAEEQIWRHAYLDALTGLPNRRRFREHLEQACRRASRHGTSLALLFLDLDQFKDVNDTLGHHVGDALLTKAAQRLRDCVRESDIVARLGGDEFIVALEDIHAIHDVKRVTQLILDQFSQPFLLEGKDVYVSTSIGITFYPEDAESIDDLMKNADQAMYTAKNDGRNRYQFFMPAMQAQAQQRAEMIRDLREALVNHPFELHFQPIVDLHNGDVLRAEALIRWRHPVRGMVSPADFIPIAEETGMISDISNWVFHEAVRRVVKLRASIHPEFQIGINLSPILFRSGDATLNTWITRLKQIGLPGRALIAEITEGVLLNNSDSVERRLAAMREVGIMVAMDDFGTGYSSLSYLKKFDLDCIKIDRTFVQNLAPDSSDLALCEAIIVMAHKLGLTVVAEGVETEVQRALLTAAGCDYAQGYFFSRPLAAPDFETWLQHSRPSPSGQAAFTLE